MYSYVKHRILRTKKTASDLLFNVAIHCFLLLYKSTFLDWLQLHLSRIPLDVHKAMTVVMAMA